MCPLIIHIQTIREREVVSYQIFTSCEIGGYTLLQGRASPHLFSTSDFSSHLYPDETIPQFPKVGLMADRGPLVPVCIFSLSSSHGGETSQHFATDLSCGASCKLMMADTSVDKCPVNPAYLVYNSALTIPWGRKDPVVQ